MNNLINIDNRRKISLRQKYGLSNNAVSNALKFITFSDTAKKIRQDAMKMAKEDYETCVKLMKKHGEI